MTEPRFGFDERVGNGQNSTSWQDVDWVDIGVDTGQLFRCDGAQESAAPGRRGPLGRSACGDRRRRRVAAAVSRLLARRRAEDPR